MSFVSEIYLKNHITKAVRTYGKQNIDKDDIDAVVSVLKSDSYLTTGPWIDEFEKGISQVSDNNYCVSVSNGTAALHLAMLSLDLPSKSKVVVPNISFVASANCICYCDCVPVFCDINPDTLNIDLNALELLWQQHNDEIAAIVIVDMCGQLNDMKKLRSIVGTDTKIIQDGSHSFGVTQFIPKEYRADLVTFSFHPVKNITTGEGGAIVTDNEEFYLKLKMLRSHGIDTDYRSRHLHYYNMKSLGFNYRLTDIQAALGIAQLKKNENMLKKREQLSQEYNRLIPVHFTNNEVTSLIQHYPSGWHLFVVKIKRPETSHDLSDLEFRDNIFTKMKELGIGVNVHYHPINKHSFYKEHNEVNRVLTDWKISLNNSESIDSNIMTLPLHSGMNIDDVKIVIDCLKHCYHEAISFLNITQ